MCNSACVEGHLPPPSQGHSFSKMSLYELPPDHAGLALTVKYICWQENTTIFALPTQSRCCQSAEPGGDLQETTFLPLLRNHERYQSTIPMFPFPNDGLRPDQEKLSHHANALGCRMSWTRMDGSPAQRRTVSFLFLRLYWCCM